MHPSAGDCQPERRRATAHRRGGVVFGWRPRGALMHHGSRLVLCERFAWPTSAEVVRGLDRSFASHGVPARLLTDNGSVFCSAMTDSFLIERGVVHTRTRSGHPWTNGRIERLFRTFKETVFAAFWLLTGTAQLDRICRDFVIFYSGHRPHERWGGRTPDEVHFGRPKQPALGRADFFDGRLAWYRFG